MTQPQPPQQQPTTTQPAPTTVPATAPVPPAQTLAAFQARQLALEGLIAAAFLAWVSSILAAVAVSVVEAAVELGTAVPVLNALAAVGSLELALGRIAADEGAVAAREVPPRLGATAVFNPADPFFEVAVEQAALTDVAAIEEETKQAVRELVTAARSAGWSAPQVAPVVHDTLGLDVRRARAAVNLYVGQAPDVGERRAAHLASAYAGRLRNQRALTIARTETLRAANLGRIASFEQAANNGLYDRSRAQLEWIATLDARTCPICADLNGQRTVVGGTFDGQLPPRHPQCRCTVMLVLD